MSTALEILKKLQSIDVLKSAQTAIENTADTMVFIQQQQLFRGIRPDGKDVYPPYSPLTVYLKAQKNQPFDRVTRRDTGEYYRGIEVHVKGVNYEIESTDWKADMLNEKYGDIGLSKDSRINYVVELKPEFIRLIKQQLE